MRKVIVSVFIAGLLAGPMASFADAGVVCTVMNKLGYDNVKECEGPVS